MGQIEEEPEKGPDGALCGSKGWRHGSEKCIKKAECSVDWVT